MGAQGTPLGPRFRSGRLCDFRRQFARPGLPFEMTPWTVVRLKGTLGTAQKGHESVTRNIFFFKRYRSDIDTTATDLLLPPMDSDGGELETSRLGISEQDVHTPSRGCVENQEGPHRTTPEGREGAGLAETLEPGSVYEHVVSTPPRAESERYILRPRPLPSSKLRDFLVT
ncbi:hypothetical protein NDU88_001376 [Pleurodeles waltl]|uniref:Uncharacterized protein n=1 Tax=Pleurodeles waltl TaxID=8319 RepID=A0AAV7RCP0_PLEWA|nr:hypothetical protein NDU88_001376 [Pleurodeles waltl]